MSNSVTQQVHLVGVWCTNYSRRPGSRRLMQFSQTFLQRCILFWRAMSVSLHRLTRTSWSYFPAAFAVLSQNREWQATFLYSAEVRCFTHERSYPCYQPGVLSRPHFHGVRPSIRPKPITALPRDPAHPPFCIQRVFGLAPYGDLIWPMTMIQSIIDPKCTNLPYRTGELTASQPTGDPRYHPARH